MTRNRPQNWRRRFLKKQKTLRDDLGQLNGIRGTELQNKGVISKLEANFSVKQIMLYLMDDLKLFPKKPRSNR